MDGYAVYNDSELDKTKEEKTMGSYSDYICQQAARKSESESANNSSTTSEVEHKRIEALACALILLAVAGYQTRQDPDRVITDFAWVLTEFINSRYQPIN